MVERRLPQGNGVSKIPYFASTQKAGVEFISSGCTKLDCDLGGGWALGRIINIVGDKSTGKTLLATEAAANFLDQYPRGDVWYREAESAFDMKYAEALGIPVSRIHFARKRDKDSKKGFRTVEDMYEDLTEILKRQPQGRPGLYIVDSLDGLSSRAELKRGMDEASYKMEKANAMGELLRRIHAKLKHSRVAMIVVSQERSKIGVKFGKKTTRSGGRALDFWASQIVWLSHIQTINQTKGNQRRSVGVLVRAKVEKNKVGLPFRECEFEIQFGYGVDNLRCGIEWLEEVGKLGRAGLTWKEAVRLVKQVNTGKLSREEEQRVTAKVDKAVRRTWSEIETSFLPKRASKYGESRAEEN